MAIDQNSISRGRVNAAKLLTHTKHVIHIKWQAPRSAHRTFQRLF